MGSVGMVRIAILTGWLILVGARAETPVKPFTQYSGDELLRAFPELTGMRPRGGQADLDAVLRTAGESLHHMLASFPSVSSSEQIHELRFDRGGGALSQTEEFRYVARCAMRGPEPVMDEFRRRTASGQPAADQKANNFLVLGEFGALLDSFLPGNRARSDFHYFGRLSANGSEIAVLGFAGHPETKPRTHGIAWIDVTSGRISRVHVELAEQTAKVPFETLSTDVVFVPVTFRAVDGSGAWLPARATVHARFSGGEVHTVHRFSDYRIWDESRDLPTVAGNAATAVDSSEDAFEVLARGIQMALEHKMDGAVEAMRNSVRLNPESSLGRFHLAVALNSMGDSTGAEAEIREGLKRRPDDGPAHNFLAIVLLKRGDLHAASDEFRASAQLQPDRAVVRYNLGQVLEKLGKSQEAVSAYREACALEPNNAEYRTHLESLERSAGARGETTIRVEVRQVLVPVVATDGEGHHVNGLKQGDFQLLEDGVEQKITSFSSESAGAEAGPAAAVEPTATNGTAAERNPNPIRRTYVICIDTLHTAATSLVNVRASLEKLFRAERAGDAQYIVMAIGSGTEILANTTRDPAQVMKALDERSFQKHLLDSHRASSDFDMTRFRRSLDDARRRCDTGDPSCPSLKRRLPLEANQMAIEERVRNLSFFKQLGSVVEQLSHGSERRSLVLISDGFALVPGKEAHQLLNAYFPEFRFEALASVDRMQAEFEQVVRVASKNNITMHTVDARGLFTQRFYDASNGGSAAAAMPAVLNAMNQSDSDSQSTLSEFAAATGGIAFHNNNDLLQGLTRAFADGREYYMLGYVASNPNMDGAFRAIVVRVRDRKVAVQAKRGYWATEQ